MTETPKPSPIKPVSEALKPKNTPRRERSAPVRNPAFREHEGLKALQRDLNRKGARR